MPTPRSSAWFDGLAGSIAIDTILIGYAGLFVAAFVAATLLPAQSELVLAAMIAAGRHDLAVLLIVATIGNVLGSAINWAIGRFLVAHRDAKWFPVSVRAWDTYTALLDGTAAAPTKILRCDTTEELGCLNPGTQTLSISEDAGFRNRLRKMMASMASKIRSNTALSGEEISLLGMASIPLYKILVVNEAAAFRLADSDMNSLAEIVAVDVLVAQIDRMLDEVGRAQSGTQFVSTEEFRAWRDQVQTVKTELNRKSSAMASSLANTYRVIERTQMLESTLKNAMSPRMSASLKFGRGLSAQGLR